MKTIEDREELERQEWLRERHDWLMRRQQMIEDGDYEAEDMHIPGCGEDDTRDSRGRKLRPEYNEAGEPWWM